MTPKIPRWLELAKQFDAENLIPIPSPSKVIADNGISRVYRSHDGIYKRSIPFLTENEIFCLQLMRSVCEYVPKSKRWDKYTIWMEDLGESELVTDAEVFGSHGYMLFDMLKACALRHGDITTANIIVKDNKPYLIDWAEARLARDIRPDKRVEGDNYWMRETWRKLING